MLFNANLKDIEIDSNISHWDLREIEHNTLTAIQTDFIDFSLRVNLNKF